MSGNPVSTCQIDGQTDLPPPSCGIYIIFDTYIFAINTYNLATIRLLVTIHSVLAGFVCHYLYNYIYYCHFIAIIIIINIIPGSTLVN